MVWEWILDNKDVVIYIILAIVIISIFWNIFDVERKEIITAFENQIISVQDNDKAKLLSYTTIEYTDDKEEQDENDAYFGKRHTIITTKDNIEILELNVRYDEENQIVLLDYSCGIFWPKLAAIGLGGLLAFVLLSIMVAIFDL